MNAPSTYQTFPEVWPKYHPKKACDGYGGFILRNRTVGRATGRADVDDSIRYVVPYRTVVEDSSGHLVCYQMTENSLSGS